MARVWRILLISLAIVFVALNKLAEADLEAIFIFGDSTADVGTNNYLNDSGARADHPFNGIDYPFSKATGRFSNGYNTADMIARLLYGFYKRSPPSFLSLLQNNATFIRNLMRGVNFASGGSGILDNTGKQAYTDVIPLGEQIQQFSTVGPNITAAVGNPDTAKRLISNSLYLISVGSNDMFDYQRFNSSRMSVDLFMTTLHDTYRNHLTDLYNLGARKFAIISVPPIGCCPIERVLKGTGECFDEMNDLAQAFHASTDTLLQEFSSQFPGVTYSLGNVFDFTMTIINNPLTFRFKEVIKACCGKGTLNAEQPCNSSANLCRNRDDYLFWDMFHPTQAAAQLAAVTLVAGSLEFVTPMNFSQLALVM